MANCKFCGEKYESKNSLIPFCTPEHGYEWLKTDKGRESLRESRSKQYDAKTTRKKKAFNDNNLAKQHELTQPVFNKMRRLEELLWFRKQDKEPECISCGKIMMDWCCGHFKTVGSSGALRYEPKNTHLQCNAYCNRGLSGNIHGNATTKGCVQGILDRYGNNKCVELLEWLDANQANVKKWTCEELKENRKLYNSRIREIEIELNS